MRLWAVLLLLLAGILELPAQKKSAPKELLRMRYAAGKAYRWSMKVNFRLGKSSPVTSMNSPLTAKVKSVKGKSATVYYTSGPMKMGGSELAPLQESEVVQNERGVSTNGVLSNGTVVNLPQKPVAVGESWTGVSNVAGGMGGQGDQRVKITYTYLGKTKLNGKNYSRVGMSLSTTGQVSMLGKGVATLDADGWLFKMAMELSVKTKAAGSAKALDVRSQVSITRA